MLVKHQHNQISYEIYSKDYTLFKTISEGI